MTVVETRQLDLNSTSFTRKSRDIQARKLACKIVTVEKCDEWRDEENGTHQRVRCSRFHALTLLAQTHISSESLYLTTALHDAFFFKDGAGILASLLQAVRSRRTVAGEPCRALTASASKQQKRWKRRVLVTRRGNRKRLFDFLRATKLFRLYESQSHALSMTFASAFL